MALCALTAALAGGISAGPVSAMAAMVQIHYPVATINVEKTVTINGKRFPGQDAYSFTLTPVQAHLNGAQDPKADGQSMSADQMPMPDDKTGGTAQVTVNDFSKAADSAKKTEKDTKTTRTRSSQYQIKFTKPGWYMYKLNENVPADKDKVAGVTYDTNDYYIVIYVTQGTNSTNEDHTEDYIMNIENITAWKNESGSRTHMPDLTDFANITDNKNAAAVKNENKTTYGKVGYSNGDTLSTTFWNDAQQENVTLEKKVSGNLGDTTKNFSFDVKLTGLEKNATYALDTDGTLQAKEGVVNTEKNTVTSDAKGNASYKIYLKDDEYMTIPDLPVGAQYQFTEEANNHTASYKLASSDAVFKKGHTDVREGKLQATKASDANKASNQSLSTAVETVDSGEGDVTVYYKNTRNMTTVTGVSTSYVPFAALLAATAAAGAGAVFYKKRKHEEDV